MQKILITGSNGLLGQKLVYKLKDNPNVTCIASARGENRLVNKSGYEYAELDITNYNNVKSVDILKQIHVVCACQLICCLKITHWLSSRSLC